MSTTEPLPTEPPREPTGRPGKYQRSAGGLVAALVLTAVAVVVVMWVLGLFRNDLEIEPERIDLDERVAAAQEGGLTVVYPERLPEDWIATGAEVPTSEGGGFEIRMLTDEEDFVGIRQARGVSDTALLTKYVDEEPEEGEEIELDSVAPTWLTYTDEGGDTAYLGTIRVDGHRERLMVFGSAPPDALQDVLMRLTTAPVER